MKSKPRILIVHNKYRTPGGEESVVANEEKLLRDNGHAVDTLYFDSENIGSLSQKLYVAAHLHHNNRSAQTLRSTIARLNPDIVHLHNMFPLVSSAVYSVCQESKIPLVHTLHNYRLVCANGLLLRKQLPCELCIGKNFLPSIAHACYQDSRLASYAMSRALSQYWSKDFAKKASAFIVLSQFSRDKFLQIGLPSEKIFVKGNFVERQNLAQPTNSLVFVGRLSQEKGIETLLNAWAQVKNSSYRLKIIGSGPMESQVKSFSQKNTNVEYLGQMPKDQVFAHLGQAKALIYPSHCFENMPMAILEALALGVPAIASRIGSIPELVLHKRTGVLFTPQNTQELARVIGEFASQNSQDWSKNALAIYEERFTPEKNYSLLTEIYQTVMQ